MHCSMLQRNLSGDIACLIRIREALCGHLSTPSELMGAGGELAGSAAEAEPANERQGAAPAGGGCCGAEHHGRTAARVPAPVRTALRGQTHGSRWRSFAHPSSQNALPCPATATSASRGTSSSNAEGLHVIKCASLWSVVTR